MDCDLFMGPALDDNAVDRRTLLGWQLGNRTIQVEPIRDRIGRDWNFRQRFIRSLAASNLTILSEPVDRGIAQYPHEPRTGRPTRRIESVGVVPDANISFLQRIFRSIARAANRHRLRQQAR